MNHYECYTRWELSQKLGISYQTVYNRENKLGILNKPYNNDRVNKIINYKKKRVVIQKHNKINIIDFFLTHSDNSYRIIAAKMDLKESYVNKVLTEWIDNDKHIFVDSKINY